MFLTKRQPKPKARIRMLQVRNTFLEVQTQEDPTVVQDCYARSQGPRTLMKYLPLEHAGAQSDYMFVGPVR